MTFKHKNVFEASQREHLWHTMRDNLGTFVPEIRANKLLMCCACGRFLTQDHFNVEHLIPQQALKDDPPEVKLQLSANQRSGNILLCTKPLSIQGKTIYEQGCNSWKGRFFDKCIREFFSGKVLEARGLLTMRHQIALVCLSYLGMVREFGYQIALTPSGQLLRRQFFSPNKFLRDLPDKSQIILAGSSPKYNGKNIAFWAQPFHFKIEDSFCIVTLRSVALAIPVSRDPNIPILRHLVIKPSRYLLRPDFGTFFD